MRKQYGVSLPLMFFMCLVFEGASAEQAGDHTSRKDVKREMRELLNTIKAHTFEQKEAYGKAIENKLRDIDARTEALQARAARAKAKAQAELRERIAELKDDREVMRKKLQELRLASAQSWEDMKSGIAAAAEDLAQAYDDALSHFK